MPCSGFRPEAIAKPIASGMAIIATIRPALKSRSTTRYGRSVPQVLVAGIERIHEQLEPLPNAVGAAAAMADDSQIGSFHEPCHRTRSSLRRKHWNADVLDCRSPSRY